ncbi:MAG: hypothetical protein A2174_02435 [Candidatus Portnoybacteria bacterium RBG_13_41_18]|uniref:Uncharacterized protein n=1 Tax=Candidatus Portnoybacteria bacterium RBG_13_41_18 TaxID=1801991 RepID=A0A1G2F899_9BACT|nr:MAG: hypothetical protein A2174_02435 [Candidatus Portnoybacteria bacterium RBG_13_41_18]
MRRRPHFLPRKIKRDGKGLYINYGGCRIRYYGKTRFSKGERVQIDVSNLHLNFFKVTVEGLYVENWKLATDYEKGWKLRKIALDLKGIFVRFGRSIYRPANSDAYRKGILVAVRLIDSNGKLEVMYWRERREIWRI